MAPDILESLVKGKNAATVLPLIGLSLVPCSESNQHWQATIVNAHSDSLIRHALDGRVLKGTVLQVAAFVVVGRLRCDQASRIEVCSPFIASFSWMVNHVVHGASRAASEDSSVGRFNSEFRFFGNLAAAKLTASRVTRVSQAISRKTYIDGERNNCDCDENSFCTH